MKTKKNNYWYVLIAFIAVMIITGYVFNLGEALGKTIAN